MRCFYHQDKDAVGTCKSCGKGVCAECAVDLGKGLACRGRCEESARAIIQLVDRNVQLSTNPTKAQLVSPSIVLPAAIPRANQPADYVAAQLIAHVLETRRLHWILSIFTAVLGILVFVWGLSEGLVVLDIIGLSCLGFAVTCFAQARRSASQLKLPETQTR